MSRLAKATLMIAALVACVGKRPIEDNQRCPCAPGWSCDVSTNVCVQNGGSGGTGGTSNGGIGGQTCTVTPICSTPAGTVAAFSKLEDLYATLEGSWGLCSDWSRYGAPSDVIGIEFGPGSTALNEFGTATVGGNAYYLVSGPSGPRRGDGFGYQLTYHAYDQGAGAFGLSIHPMPNVSFGGVLRYSPCPKEIEFRLYPTDPNSLLIAIGDGTGFGRGGTGGGGGASGGGGGSPGKTYPLTFVCSQQDGGSDCPAGQPCPEVPLSQTSCGDIPGVLGHEPIPQTTGRPVGCAAMLPYGNPFSGDAQVQCSCTALPPGDARGKTTWVCPL